MNLGLTDIQLIKIENRLSKVGIDLHLNTEEIKDKFSKAALWPTEHRYLFMIGLVEANEPSPQMSEELKDADRATQYSEMMRLYAERDSIIEQKAEAICWQIDHILEDNSLKSAERQIAELHLEGVSRSVLSELYSFSTSKLNRIINRRVRVRDRYS